MRAELERAAQTAGCLLTPLTDLGTAAARVTAVPAHGPLVAIAGEARACAAGSPVGEMLLVKAGAMAPDVGAWPDGSQLALTHPGLRGCVNVAGGYGARLVVDTSLGMPGPLRNEGGYHSPADQLVALAPDSSYAELVHELTHLKFDARVLAPAASCATDAEAEQLLASEPLHAHWRALRARGYSRACAEELLVREHEMFTLRAAPPWRRLARTWVLWDSALAEAALDLQATPTAERPPCHADELRRVLRLRTYVTGPRARALHLGWMGLLAVGVATGVASAVRR